MSRRILFIPAALLLLASTACKTTSVESADTEAAASSAAATAEGEAADSSEAAPVEPVSFEAVDVATPDGVEDRSELAARDDLKGTWLDCATPLGVTVGLDDARQPVGRLLLDGQHLYVVAQHVDNGSQVLGYTLELSAEGCRIDARPDFADNGVLTLGGGSVDVDLFGDLLVSTGTQTRVFDPQGAPLELCEHLASHTRLRGAGANGVARRGGEELLRATIDRSTCTVSPLPKLSGEELLGMQLAVTEGQNLYATLQVGSVANALGYFEEGKLAWRYFAGNETVGERMNLITSLSIVGEDVLAIRSLPRTLQVISSKAERRMEIDLNKDEAFSKLSYPYVSATVDAGHVLVAFRNHEPESELVTASLRLLQLTAKD